MRKLSRLLLPTALTGLLLSCGQDTLGPDAEMDLVQAASSDVKNPAQERWVSEYFTPFVAEFYGLRTYRCTFGECEGEDEFTSEIMGEETVPYQTGALTGVRVRFADGETVVYVDKKLFYFLTREHRGVLGEATYYVSTAISPNCVLEAPPPEAEWGGFVDGMILDNSGTFRGVNRDDQTECVAIDIPATDGGEDSGVTLMQIQDVRVGGKKYNNALLMWELEPYLEFPGFDELGSQYLEQELGITLPTWDDIKGARINPLGPAIDDLLILGFHKGPIALVGVGNEDGILGDIWELVSIEPLPFASKIVFVSDRDGNPEIYVMNVHGWGQTRLTDNSAQDRHPRWSPNGQKIAFWSNRDGNPEVYVMNADGSGQTNLTTHPAQDRRPSWSPDGNKIAFATNRDGNGEIYVMNADGSGHINLTNSPGGDARPSWSPDGNKIAFATNRDGNWEIYVMNADGTGETRLTTDPAVDGSPRWSPNGRQIAFQSIRDGNWEVHIMNADGSGQTNLTTHPANDWRPDWSCAGARVVGECR